ncbi:MAG: hypothetical protein GX375_05785 [Clostridiales bacterium]|nr:hypothetical protein [Clostridiales bacterium]
MRVKKIFFTSIFIILIAALAFMIYSFNSSSNLGLQAVAHAPISIRESDKIFFYKGGFAVSGEYTNFFDGEGDQSESPFKFQDENQENFVITAMTSNYIMLNGNTIYEINDMSLSQVYSLGSLAIGMKEFDEYLLIIWENENGLKLNYLDVENGTLSEFGFDQSFYYMDAHSHKADSLLSVLTLDIDGFFPSSKILHYDKSLALYGITTVTDQVFYRIFRYPSSFLLIGNQELVCYNMEGELKWEVENKSVRGFQVAENNKGLLVYLGSSIKTDHKDEKFNGLYIDGNGESSNVQLPTQLSKLSPYKDGFLGLQYGKKLLTFNREGKIQEEYFIDDDIKDIVWNPHHPNSFFVTRQDNTLQIYSTKQEEK